MKKLIVLFVMVGALFACSGDCLSCHPALEATILTDERHKPMLTCITCHRSESSGLSACGKDCFECHPIEKINPDVKEHEVIKLCADCHKKIPVIEGALPLNDSQSTMKSLLFN